MSTSYDIIIPVAFKETGFVWRVVRYIRKNLPEVEYIYIISSLDNIRHIKHIHDNNTILLNEDEICSELTFSQTGKYLDAVDAHVSTGWYFQQFLKFGFALSSYAKKYYLSWDADTLPLSHIKFFKDASPLFTMKTEYNPNYFKTINKLLGLKKITEGSFIAEHMLFDSDKVKELIHKIETSDVKGENWIQKIVNACDFKESIQAFSEFKTYGTFVSTYYPKLYKARQLNTFRKAGFIQGRQISDKRLEEMSFDLDTASFELKDYPLFPYNITDLITTWRAKYMKIKGMNMNTILSKIAWNIKH